MSEAMIKVILGWWLIATLIIITVVDVCFVVRGDSQLTVSNWFHEMAQKRPVLYFLVGMAVGHLLVPLTVTNGK